MAGEALNVKGKGNTSQKGASKRKARGKKKKILTPIPEQPKIETQIHTVAQAQELKEGRQKVVDNINILCKTKLRQEIDLIKQRNEERQKQILLEQQEKQQKIEEVQDLNQAAEKIVNHKQELEKQIFLDAKNGAAENAEIISDKPFFQGTTQKVTTWVLAVAIAAGISYTVFQKISTHGSRPSISVPSNLKDVHKLKDSAKVLAFIENKDVKKASFEMITSAASLKDWKETLNYEFKIKNWDENLVMKILGPWGFDITPQGEKMGTYKITLVREAVKPQTPQSKKQEVAKIVKQEIKQNSQKEKPTVVAPVQVIQKHKKSIVASDLIKSTTKQIQSQVKEKGWIGRIGKGIENLFHRKKGPVKEPVKKVELVKVELQKTKPKVEIQPVIVEKQEDKTKKLEEAKLKKEQAKNDELKKKLFEEQKAKEAELKQKKGEQNAKEVELKKKLIEEQKTKEAELKQKKEEEQKAKEIEKKKKEEQKIKEAELKKKKDEAQKAEAERKKKESELMKIKPLSSDQEKVYDKKINDFEKLYNESGDEAFEQVAACMKKNKGEPERAREIYKTILEVEDYLKAKHPVLYKVTQDIEMVKKFFQIRGIDIE